MAQEYRPSLDGISAKEHRAVAHFRALNDDITRVFAEQQDTVMSNLNKETGWTYLTLLSDPDPIPALQWGVQLGDIIHNLRSALDHLVAQLVGVNGGDPATTRAQFPIADYKPHYWAKNRRGVTFRDRYLDGVCPIHKEVIDGLQPFKRDDPEQHPLSILRELSNADKHRVLHAVTANVRPPQVVVLPWSKHLVESYELEPLNIGREAAKNTTIARIRFAPNPEAPVQLYMKPRVGVVFGEQGIGLPAIEGIGKEVERIVRIFGPIIQRGVKSSP